jgi:hypothetical protein
MTFTPTQANNDPACCHVCGRHAIGVGIGGPRDADPRFLCAECVQLIEQIRRVRRFDPYELEARAGGMDAAADLVDEFGPDLSQWDEDQVLMFCGAIWRGCADRLREIVRDGTAPF